MVAATAGYTLVQNATHLLMLCIVQGLSFGMAATAGITLAIDITNSTFRSAGNVVFSWAARLGMIIGAALGCICFGHMALRLCYMLLWRWERWEYYLCQGYMFPFVHLSG